MTKISAPPHDLLKVLTWRGHPTKKKQYSKYGHTNLKYLESIKNIENFQELADAIANHPEWLGDKLASAIARLRWKYSFWKPSGEKETEINDPFFVKTYGKPRYWSLKEREGLFNKIIEIYRNKGINEDAHAEVNELLSEYPQDSRFPLVSLKTHHWATWAIQRQIGDKDVINSILLLKISVYAPGISDKDRSFHRLKDLRRFYSLRERIAVGLIYLLREYHPIRLKDCEDILVITTKDNFDIIKELLISCDFPVEVEVFEFSFKREGKEYYKISNFTKYYLGFGIKEELDSYPEKAEWVDILNGRFDYVAWIALKTSGLYDSSEKFLNWFEKFAENLYNINKAKKLKDERKGDWLCYELLISVADGYSEFLTSFERRLKFLRKVIKSFDLSLYLYGLKDLKNSFWIYTVIKKTLRDLDLHIPIFTPIVVSDPKYPFWRILEIVTDKNSGIYILKGDRMIELPDDIVDLINKVRYSVEGEARRRIHLLARYARKMSLKNLELQIDIMYNEEKIKKDDAYDAIKYLVREIAKRIKDENMRREVTSQALEALEVFTKERGY